MTEPFKDNIYIFAEATISMANEIISLMQEQDTPLYIKLTHEERVSLINHRETLIASVTTIKRDLGVLGIEALYILGIAAITACFGEYNHAAAYIKQAKTYAPSRAIRQPLERLNLEVAKRQVIFITEDQLS